MRCRVPGLAGSSISPCSNSSRGVTFRGRGLQLADSLVFTRELFIKWKWFFEIVISHIVREIFCK